MPPPGRAADENQRNHERGWTRPSALPVPSISRSSRRSPWCSALRPATYLGKGKVEELSERVKIEEIGLVVMDCALSPVQQRNLEKAWAPRSRPHRPDPRDLRPARPHQEGTLQVELAHLNYQKSRLVRSWTHLERQRGGFGFLGGPGETQIEADRRMIQERITKIERELDR
jgi:GTP-binding protein HflX